MTSTTKTIIHDYLELHPSCYNLEPKHVSLLHKFSNFMETQIYPHIIGNDGGDAREPMAIHYSRRDFNSYQCACVRLVRTSHHGLKWHVYPAAGCPDQQTTFLFNVEVGTFRCMEECMYLLFDVGEFMNINLWSSFYFANNLEDEIKQKKSEFIHCLSCIILDECNDTTQFYDHQNENYKIPIRKAFDYIINIEIRKNIRNYQWEEVFMKHVKTILTDLKKCVSTQLEIDQRNKSHEYVLELEEIEYLSPIDYRIHLTCYFGATDLSTTICAPIQLLSQHHFKEAQDYFFDLMAEKTESSEIKESYHDFLKTSLIRDKETIERFGFDMDDLLSSKDFSCDWCCKSSSSNHPWEALCVFIIAPFTRYQDNLCIECVKVMQQLLDEEEQKQDISPYIEQARQRVKLETERLETKKRKKDQANI
jgi:hypothetical protein